MTHSAPHIRRVVWIVCCPREHGEAGEHASVENPRLKIPEFVRKNICCHTPGFPARMWMGPKQFNQIPATKAFRKFSDIFLCRRHLPVIMVR